LEDDFTFCKVIYFLSRFDPFLPSKEIILEERKQHYKEKKDEILEKRQEYYKQNYQTKIAEQRKAKEKCECGMIVSHYGMKRHKGSTRHLKSMEAIQANA